MKAAVLDAFGSSLALREMKRPIPAPDEILLAVEACGICHSDLHLMRGSWPAFAKTMKLPRILGHEAVGRVVEVGSEVRSFVPGDRAGLWWYHWTCGICPDCRKGRENLCQKQVITGAMTDGGFAEFAIAKASHAARIPPNLPSETASPFLCAGVTAYRAVHRAGIQPGQRVAVFGVGGLGQFALQFARLAEAWVLAVDVSAEKLEVAREAGAVDLVDASGDGAWRKLRAAGGVDIAIVTTAAKSAYDDALRSISRGGTLVVVGLPAEDLSFPALHLAGGEIRILSTAVGTREDVNHVLRMASDGLISCRTERFELKDVNRALDLLAQGRIRGRAILVPSA